MKNQRSAGALLGGLCAVVLLSAPIARAGTTINETNRQGYGANIGWLDARGDVVHGASIGQFHCTGHVWSANCGWIGLGHGPTNGCRYGNTSTNDWGVNHDGEGNLSGYAYAANVGWIVFEQTNGLPKIDLRTGSFSGYAWGANIGWIGLSNAQAFVETDAFATGPDSDSDGLPDPWELSRAGNLHVFRGGTNDWDRDGSTDTEEYGADTNPNDEDELFRIVSFTNASPSVLQWSARPTRLYRVERTNNMPVGAAGDWFSANILFGPYAASPAELALPALPVSTQVYRVRAVLPPGE